MLTFQVRYLCACWTEQFSSRSFWELIFGHIFLILSGADATTCMSYLDPILLQVVNYRSDMIRRPAVSYHCRSACLISSSFIMSAQALCYIEH
uniref:Putative secreted protein n=1 Tax=Ixodes ricinus TaxID=34613 RepID=A0A6B0U267_IXORI